MSALKNSNSRMRLQDEHALFRSLPKTSHSSRDWLTDSSRRRFRLYFLSCAGVANRVGCDAFCRPMFVGRLDAPSEPVVATL